MRRILSIIPGVPLLLAVSCSPYKYETVGGKNDPSETTGLAHYFEHLMFNGTEQFGTSDYAAEKPLLAL